jgi:hypothetical protein
MHYISMNSGKKQTLIRIILQIVNTYSDPEVIPQPAALSLTK